LKQLESLDFNQIRFQSREPRVTLNISSLYTSSFTSEDDAISTGILSKLKEILEPRIVSTISSIYSTRTNLTLIVTIVGFLLVSQNIIIINNITKLTISLIEVVLLIAINRHLIFKSNRDKLPVIITNNPSLKNNFFLEHKNQIKLLMIGGLITLVVQVLVQLIKEKILNP
jgi:hypothetical protein